MLVGSIASEVITNNHGHVLLRLPLHNRTNIKTCFIRIKESKVKGCMYAGRIDCLFDKWKQTSSPRTTIAHLSLHSYSKLNFFLKKSIILPFSHSKVQGTIFAVK